MRGLYWNCRGIGRLVVVLELRLVGKKFSLDFICLSETKIKDVCSPLNRVGFYSFVEFPAVGSWGGIVFAWKTGLDVEVISSSPNSVNLLIYLAPSSTPWLITCVYGPTLWHLREGFWHELDVVANSFGGPWICVVDFNCLVADWEKQGGLPLASLSLNPLQNFINTHGLIDLGFSDSPFTWSNNRDGLANIRERLDRGLANCAYRTLLPRAIIVHLVRSASDHSPLFLDTAGGAPPLKKLFHFESFWLADVGCEEVVDRSWNVTTVGSLAFRLCLCTKDTKKELKHWNIHHFGCIQNNIGRFRHSLAWVQS